MADFNGKYIRGVLGALIFKKTKRGETVCSRPAPGTMKQTQETKKASNGFGMAIRICLCKSRIRLSKKLMHKPESIFVDMNYYSTIGLGLPGTKNQN